MEISISEQLIACLAFLVFGAVSAVCYDVVRIFHICTGVHNSVGKARSTLLSISVFLIDILYCAIVTVAFSVIAFAYSYGKLRGVNLFCFGVGFAAYLLTFGRLVMFFSEKIVYAVKFVIRTIIKFLFIPVKFIARMFAKFAVWIYGSTIGLIFRKIQRSRQKKFFEDALGRLSTDVRFSQV